MDYLDRVFIDLRQREPGRYPLDRLKERDRFIEAVKELMDGGWLTELYFTEDYRTLVIQTPLEEILCIKRKARARKAKQKPAADEPTEEEPEESIIQ